MAKESKGKIVKSGPMKVLQEGGSNRMYGKGHAGAITPGQTASNHNASPGKFLTGGKNKMLPTLKANTQKPGRASQH